ncbi:MAG: EAL domain-containing protein [Clostridiales bacterium]|nr:EAL domain-containing protein [Clostridiales bacterium]
MALQYMNNYSPVGDVGILVMCLVMIIVLHESFIHANQAFKIFYWTIMIILAAASTNLLFYMTCVGGAPIGVVMLFRALYHICMICAMQCYVVYFYNMFLLKDTHIVAATGVVNIALCALDIVLCAFDVIVPIPGSFKTYDNPFTIWLFLAFVFSLAACAILIIRHRDSMINQMARALAITEAICVIMLIVEFFYKHNSFMTLTFLMPMLIIMFMAHSNPYSAKTGALNMESFEDFLEDRIDNDTYFMCIRFICKEDFKISDELGMCLKSFWRGYFKKAAFFNPVPEFLVLAIDGANGTQDEIASNAEKLILEVFPKYYSVFGINYKIVTFSGVEFCKSYQVFAQIFDYFAEDMGENAHKICGAEDMDGLHRHYFIITQLEDIYNKFDLNDERVLVYCQPIINTKLRIYDTAEALMRMQLPELGFIYPNEFIPLVEKYGLIHRFSMIILNKVCKKLSELEDYRIKRISVNFSVYELRNQDFVNDFKAVVTANGISYDKVGVEFTESTDINDFEKIKNVIAQLRQLGCSIYLDDFGTGYSNFERLLGLNMDVVKFDRSLVVLASDNVKAKYVMKSFSDAFTKMEFKVLYEGIETNEQEELCVDSNANYLQGYKYSKPIPIEELPNFLQKKSA